MKCPVFSFVQHLTLPNHWYLLSLLTNKLTDIQSIIADHKPHILGLGEANFKKGQDLADVALPGYNLHLGQGVDNEQAARTARVAVYTHTALRVKR